MQKGTVYKSDYAAMNQWVITKALRQEKAEVLKLKNDNKQIIAGRQSESDILSNAKGWGQ